MELVRRENSTLADAEILKVSKTVLFPRIWWVL